MREWAKKLLAMLAIAPVRVYQLAVSPLLPVNCRYLPSCSEYAVDALREHGLFRGSWLAVKRIGRCHPWGGHGLDPVPPAGRDCAGAQDDEPHKPTV